MKTSHKFTRIAMAATEAKSAWDDLSTQSGHAIRDLSVAEHDAGISFVAFSRFGKTFAIEVLSAQLSASFRGGRLGALVLVLQPD
jgi:hypothetical protein